MKDERSNALLLKKNTMKQKCTHYKTLTKFWGAIFHELWQLIIFCFYESPSYRALFIYVLYQHAICIHNIPRWESSTSFSKFTCDLQHALFSPGYDTNIGWRRDIIFGYFHLAYLCFISVYICLGLLVRWTQLPFVHLCFRFM